MSDATKLRKLSRQIKLLEHLQFISNNRLANQTAELVSLQVNAAELDKAANLDFLDFQLAYRALLEPKMREISKKIEIEAARSTVLKRRTQAIAKTAMTAKSRAQDLADHEQLQALSDGLPSLGSPARHKPKPR